jgi:hypothetical protein
MDIKSNTVKGKRQDIVKDKIDIAYLVIQSKNKLIFSGDDQ